jgi:hypothetical protein
MLKRIISATCFLTIIFVFQALESSGQTYPVTIQGSLVVDNVPANGLYDIEVLLRDAAVGGNDYGSRFFASTQVTNGVFTLTSPWGQFGGPLLMSNGSNFASNRAMLRCLL